MLSDYQGLVDRLVRDDAGKLTAADRDEAIGLALIRYGQARPRQGVADVMPTGDTLPLPAGWVVGSSTLAGLEYPIGQVPPALIPGELYLGPDGLVVMLATRPAGPVRMRYTLQQALSASEDTIPAGDREAVAKYAAALLCEQLASFYASDTDSTISADRSFGQTRSQAFAARAREYRKQFQAALGIEEKTAAPAGAVVQLNSFDSRGRPRLFHRRA
jgi:hypothetical protein